MTGVNPTPGKTESPQGPSGAGGRARSCQASSDVRVAHGPGRITPRPFSFARCHKPNEYGHFFRGYGYRAVEYRPVILDSGYSAVVHGPVDGGYEHCEVGYADMKVEYLDFTPGFGH